MHNQRIERLWRDVFQNVSLPFYQWFYVLEDQDLLDVGNEVHIRVLQFSFLPLYNRRLSEWTASWNRHNIRTAGNKSPMQLWLSEEAANTDHEEVKFCSFLTVPFLSISNNFTANFMMLFSERFPLLSKLFDTTGVIYGPFVY